MSGSRIRVAVVDDDASVRTAFGRLLRAATFDVAVFASGHELIKSLDLFRPSCIVLDIHMTGLTGFDLQHYLSQLGCRTPIIVITGHDSPTARAHSFALGATAYFSKPVEGDDLVKEIKKAVADLPLDTSQLHRPDV